MPATAKFTLTPAELIRALEAGRSPEKIATEHGVSPQCVRWHIRQLTRHVAAPAARRAEEFVSVTLAAFHDLAENLRVLRLLREACLEQLAHPYDPAALDVGPHSYDLEVTVIESRGSPPIRRTVPEILAGHSLISIEGKFADPRLLLLKVMQEIRAQLTVAVQLADRIHSLQEVEAFQRDVLDAITEADPDTAARIKGALQQRRALRSALAPTHP